MATVDEPMDVAETPDDLMEQDDITEAARLQALETVDPVAAMATYAATVAAPAETPDAEQAKVTAYQRVAALYAKHGRVPELKGLVQSVQPFLTKVSKAKGGKLFRSIIDAFLSLQGHIEDKVTLLFCLFLFFFFFFFFLFFSFQCLERPRDHTMYLFFSFSSPFSFLFFFVFFFLLFVSFLSIANLLRCLPGGAVSRVYRMGQRAEAPVPAAGP